MFNLFSGKRTQITNHVTATEARKITQKQANVQWDPFDVAEFDRLTNAIRLVAINGENRLVYTCTDQQARKFLPQLVKDQFTVQKEDSKYNPGKQVSLVIKW